MSTNISKSVLYCLLFAAIVAVLLHIPLASHAQAGNTATGYLALSYRTYGCCNTADGFLALMYDSTGSYNTANGFFALNINTEV